jgi:hypothetical protein
MIELAPSILVLRLDVFVFFLAGPHLLCLELWRNIKL